MRGFMFGAVCLTAFGVLRGLSAGDGAMMAEKMVRGVSAIVIIGAVWLLWSLVKKLTHKDQ